MSVLVKLVSDCDAKGIRLLPAGEDGLTIDAPKDALTPDLIQRLKDQKGELLTLFRPEAEALTDASAVWQAALDRLEGNPLFPPEAMAALRSAEVRWDNHAHDGPGPYTAGQEPT